MPEPSETEPMPELTLTQFARIIAKNLEVTYVVPRGRWVALFSRSVAKSGGGFESASGEGATPEEALAAYARAIRGKTLCFSNTGDKDDVRYQVPANLKVE